MNITVKVYKVKVNNWYVKPLNTNYPGCTQENSPPESSSEDSSQSEWDVFEKSRKKRSKRNSRPPSGFRKHGGSSERKKHKNFNNSGRVHKPKSFTNAMARGNFQALSKINRQTYGSNAQDLKITPQVESPSSETEFLTPLSSCSEISLNQILNPNAVSKCIKSCGEGDIEANEGVNAKPFIKDTWSDNSSDTDSESSSLYSNSSLANANNNGDATEIDTSENRLVLFQNKEINQFTQNGNTDLPADELNVNDENTNDAKLLLVFLKALKDNPAFGSTFNRHPQDAEFSPEESRSKETTSNFQELFGKKKEVVEKRYSCDTCDFKSSTKSGLKRHLCRFTGVKPYQCDICGKRYTTESYLKQHRIQHSGVKPFVCGYCGKRFFWKREKMFHERQHTGERPYKCPLCGLDYPRKDTLKKHAAIKHRITAPTHKDLHQQRSSGKFSRRD